MFLDYKKCRKISGILFLTGHITLFMTNTIETNWLQLIASILFMSCSVSLILSAKNHRWLFYAGLVVILGYIFTIISKTGDGSVIQYIGLIGGIIGGLLIFRSAFQRETGQQFKLPDMINFIDKYPLASAGLIEGVCCLLISIGALINNDYRLALCSFIWMIAQGFLAASDEFIRKKFNHKH
jgi:hypothetical protein